MTNDEKLVLLEEIFEVDSGGLTADTTLDSLDGFDSMGKLSLIALFDELNRKLSTDQIRGLKKIGDIMILMD